MCVTGWHEEIRVYEPFSLDVQGKQTDKHTHNRLVKNLVETKVMLSSFYATFFIAFGFTVLHIPEVL